MHFIYISYTDDASIISSSTTVLYYYSIIDELFLSFFFFSDTATTEIYTLSLHDALPICLLWKTPIFPSNSRFPRLCAKCLLKLKRQVSILPMTKSKK